MYILFFLTLIMDFQIQHLYQNTYAQKFAPKLLHAYTIYLHEDASSLPNSSLPLSLSCRCYCEAGVAYNPAAIPKASDLTQMLEKSPISHADKVWIIILIHTLIYMQNCDASTYATYVHMYFCICLVCVLSHVTQKL